jgi:hypothetical protein
LAQRDLNKGVIGGRLGCFLLQLSLSLEAIFYLPPSTYVFIELTKVSMKEGLIFSLKGISKVGVFSFRQLRY